MAREPSPPDSDPTRYLATADVPSDAVLTSLLGAEFVAYVCAAPVAHITLRIENTAALLSGAQEMVFQETLRAARLLAARRRPMMFNDLPALEPLSEAFARFGQFIPEHGMSIANALRVQAGGTLEDTQGGDELQRSVARLALDWFPVLLIPEEKDPRLAGMPFALRMGAFAWEHAGVTDFIEALDRPEEPLRALFTSGHIDRATTSRQLMSNSGRGGNIQLGTLVSTLLSNAEMRVRSHGRLELKRFLADVRTQIDELRQLSAGGPVRVPTVVGLGTAQVADDFASTPLGVCCLLRPNGIASTRRFKRI